MTKLETLMKYAQSLPVESQNQLVDGLLEAMKGQTHASRLSQDEIEDVKAALAEPNPEYASPDEITALLGASFR